uniref:Large ribosomal subunit protein uL6c n=1 Tax=Asparagopsis taxiformis TaxID=260499 RepID=A0A1C9CCE0_9FLOR|nr:ribosomal protein L6 [Asparagopsis taxiformis]AOM66068.1 ribosomal protein L6 [Asparagopsis taxiformis]
MSRIGKKTIVLPDTVNTIINNSVISVQGPKGELSYKLSPLITIKNVNNTLLLQKVNQSKESQIQYGLSRTLVNNMVIGVSQGFNKKLEIQGVGYRAQTDGNNLILNVGYSHPVIINPPEQIFIKVENNTNIIVSGINKELVGQIAAKIRQIRPPEPYKGKGIRYVEEIVKRKVGKAGK